MAKTNSNPSYLPEDFIGLPSIQEGNQRYYYKEQDGKNLLIGVIIGKRHVVIRFPEGSTIVIPPNSVGSEQIIDDSIEMEDLNDDVKSKMHHSYDASTEGIKLGGITDSQAEQ